MKNMPWEKAIYKVLEDAKEALHYSEIAERIVSERLRTSVGATPAATVAANLSQSLKDENGPYMKVRRGEYALKPLVTASNEPLEAESIEAVVESGALSSFGMYWRREFVYWSRTQPKLLGKQQEGALQVDFAGQIGIYLLYDRDRVIYVGRASESIAKRLKTHTTDRLSGRWDRFSWFGLRGVGENGNLTETSADWSQATVVETMEALLIESLEPPLNKKGGDNFSGIEYLQIVDPDLKKRQEKELLKKISDKLGM